MYLRSLRSLPALLVASSFALALAPAAYAAGPKEKEAQKLYDAAINDDYLNADFPKAEKHLKDALGKCGASGCSAEFLGKVHIAMGTVFAIGLSKTDEAKEQFIAAIKADAGAALIADLTTPELTALFKEAQKAAGKGGGGHKAAPPGDGPSKGASADAQHSPPPEAPVNTPLPLYVEPSDEMPLTKVTLWYKPFGAKTYKNVDMRKVSKGYGFEIPCDDVSTTGDIKYWFAFTGEGNVAAGSLGSNKEPFKVTIKSEIEGDKPKLPGSKAPAQCKAREACPPGFTGPECAPDTSGKGEGGTCDVTSDCKSGLVCNKSTCEKEGGSSTGKRNLVSLGVQINAMVINGADQVCDGADASYECFIQGTKHQYFGKSVVRAGTNGIQGGLAVPGITILAGYDRQLLQNLGLTLGLRLGVTIGGSPSPDNLATNGGPPPSSFIETGKPFQSTLAPAKSFLPFFGEARLGYHFGDGVMADKSFRPYLFIGGGLAQVNGSVPVVVCDQAKMAGDTATSPQACPKTTPKSVQRQVDAYQITGLNFIEFGAGTTFGITQYFGLAVEAKFMFMIPTFGVVIAPNIGPVVAF